MSNPYYTATGNPGTRTTGLSQLVRSEYLAVQAGFDLLPAVDGSGRFPWSGLPTEAQSVPIMFPVIGLPPSGQIYNRILGYAFTIPANFSGSTLYATTAVSLLGSKVWTLNKISSTNTVTQIGTLTVIPATHTGVTLSVQGAASIAANEAIQLVAPSPQDSLLADLCFTILAQKV